MPFVKSIASRIFGLAILLVCLMIALASFLLYQVTVLKRQLEVLSGYYAPLDLSIVNLNEAGLRRRLAFERWHESLSGGEERAAAKAEATANYERFSVVIREELGRIRGFLSAPPEGPVDRSGLERIGSLIGQIEANYELITARQAEILALAESGEKTRANDLLGLLDEVQVILQNQRGEVRKEMDAILSEATLSATRRHREIVWTTVFATITSVLLGLSVAALVTNRLVRPVRSLMSGLATVESGDLSIQLPVASGDEIGALTRSFNFFVSELRKKEELRSTFGKYIDPRILEQLLPGSTTGDLSGGRREMSVSFGDLVGFTAIGEQLTPAGVVNLLNRHFALQAEAVQQHHGVVDKFMGDAIMAFWGPPFTREGEDALLACRAALEQARAVARLRAELPEITGLRKNLPDLDVRIGISTGEVVVGNIGSETTRSYTVIGDNVNLASRLEHANRFYGTRILMCESTRTAAGDRIVAREIDSIVVKGKTEPTLLYELAGLGGEVPPETLALCERSSAALEAYRGQRWDEAEAAFRECLDLAPGDRTAAVFLERIAAFREHAPAPDWNGTWTFLEK